MDKGDMIWLYKILHGFLEGLQWQDFFQMADTSRLRDAEVVTSSSVKMFKNKLEAHLKNLPRRSPE